MDDSVAKYHRRSHSLWMTLSPRTTDIASCFTVYWSLSSPYYPVASTRTRRPRAPPTFIDNHSADIPTVLLPLRSPWSFAFEAGQGWTSIQRAGDNDFLTAIITADGHYSSAAGACRLGLPGPGLLSFPPRRLWPFIQHPVNVLGQ